MPLLSQIVGLLSTTGLGRDLIAAQAPEPARAIKIGLASSFVVLDSASAAKTAMMSDAVDAAVSGPGEVIAAQTRGPEVVAIPSVYKPFSGTLVLDRGVAQGRACEGRDLLQLYAGPDPQGREACVPGGEGFRHADVLR